MRITLLGNIELPYSSETYYVKTLREMGHQVVALHESEATGQEVLDQALQSDLFVWIHGHSERTPGLPMKEVLNELKKCGIITMTWHHDLFVGLGRSNKILEEDVYTNIDHFFSTDKLMIDWINRETRVKGHYLPSAVYQGETKYLLPSGGDAELFNKDVVFVGNKGYHPEWPYRPQLINWLTEEYGDSFGWYSGEEDSFGLKRGLDMNQLFADSKVVVGDSLCIDFNYPYYWSDRVWETLGRGGFLIMPYIKGLDDYLEDGKHLVFYEFGDFDDLRKKIDFYLENDQAREYIRKTGHEYVKKHHTYRNRWEHILDELSL